MGTQCRQGMTVKVIVNHFYFVKNKGNTEKILSTRTDESLKLRGKSNNMTFDCE